MRAALERKIIAGFALAAIFLSVVGAISWSSTQRATKEAEWVRHTQEVLTRLAELSSALTDAETAVRGFAITGDETYLEPYTASLAASKTGIERIHFLTIDNPSQQDNLKELKPLIEKRYAALKHTVSLGHAQGIGASKQEIATGRGKRIQDEIRLHIAKMIASENALLTQRNAIANSANQKSLAINVASTVFALVGLALLLPMILRDLTARLSAQAMLRVRNEELGVASERAMSADRMKSAFLATMSHELRTPLNSIIGFTGILLQKLAGPINPEQTKQLEMVQRSARHLLELINDVLDLSKIEAGQLEVERVPFDLRTSIEKVAAMVGPQAKKKDLLLRVDIAPDIAEVASDQRRIEQILLNLLSNALKFTDQGEVTLKAECDTHAITLRVSDSGMGIKPEDLKLLFQPFQQIDSALSRQREGTGLGLTICRRLADLLGGSIAVESQWGQGSEFVFTLPLVEAKPSDQMTP